MDHAYTIVFKSVPREDIQDIAYDIQLLVAKHRQVEVMECVTTIDGIASGMIVEVRR